MSWFGGGLSNLQGKITSFTAQVLSDVAESVQGDDDQADALDQEGKTERFSERITQLQQQNEELVNQNRDLESQLATLSRQYRNLLSRESKVNDAGSSPIEAQLQAADTWQKNVQRWLKAQGIELPPQFGDPTDDAAEFKNNGTDQSDDTHNELRNVLEQKIALLEEQLVDLDQQHQAALDVTISSRDQLKEDNRLLQLKVDQLTNQLNQPADKKAENGGAPCKVSESLERLENDHQAARTQFSHFREQFRSLNERVKSCEELRAKCEELEQANVSTSREVDLLSAENAALRIQNERLVALTSVLDRVTEENRSFESRLEETRRILLLREEEVEKMRAHLSTKANERMEASTEPLNTWADNDKLVEENRRLEGRIEELHCQFQSQQKPLTVESCTEPQSDWPESQQLTDDNFRLKEQVEELTRLLNQQSESQLERGEQLIEENNRMRSRIAEVERALEEADVRRKSEADSTRQQLESLAAENSQLKGDLNTARSALEVNAELIERLQSVKIESEATVEVATEPLSSWPDVQRLTEENALLQASLNERDTKSREEINQLSSQNGQLKKLLAETEQALEQAEGVRRQSEAEMAFQHQQLLASKRSEIDQFEKHIHQLQSNLDEAQRAVQLNEGRMRELEAELANSRASVDDVQHQLLNEKREWQSQLDDLKIWSNSLDAEKQQALNEANQLREELVHVRDNGRDEFAQLQSRLETLQQEVESWRARCKSLEENQSSEDQLAALSTQIAEAQESLARTDEAKTALERERDQLVAQATESNAEKDLLRDALKAFQQQREQLVLTVQQKHQESVNYHAETMRLAKICEELQARLNEQSEQEIEASRIRAEKEAQWQSEMDRLRDHLVTVEETYTHELLKSQTKEKVLRESLQSAEERVSEQWRMGDQLAGWQEKHRQWTTERETLEREKAELARSLDRLQHALQQLTKERERDIVQAQKELAQKLAKAESLQKEKDSEMALLRRKLSEAQMGLEAAGRLTLQLDKTATDLATARDEVRSKEAECSRVRQQLEQLQSGSENKVDKSLVKNLLVGYFAAPSAKHRLEVLRIVATVMDFSAEERSKAGLEETANGLGGWASGMLKKTSRSRTSSGNSSIGDAEKSLSEAFISFLESESARPSPPKLSTQSIVGGSPPAAVKPPSMPEFHPGRNEPTILRDVLRDAES